MVKQTVSYGDYTAWCDQNLFHHALNALINRACVYDRIRQIIPNICNVCREKMFS